MLPVLLLELRRSRGPARLDAVPVIVAACAVAVCGGAHPVGRVADVPVGVTDALRAATGVAALVTPLALLATVLQGGPARSSVADLVLRPAEGPSVDGVQRAIRGTPQAPAGAGRAHPVAGGRCAAFRVTVDRIRPPRTVRGVSVGAP